MVKKFVVSVLVATAACSLIAFLLGMLGKPTTGYVNLFRGASLGAGFAALFAVPASLLGGLVFWIYKRRYGSIIRVWIPSLISAIIAGVPPSLLLVAAFHSFSPGGSEIIAAAIGLLFLAIPCFGVISAIFGAGVGQR